MDGEALLPRKGGETYGLNEYELEEAVPGYKKPSAFLKRMAKGFISRDSAPRVR